MCRIGEDITKVRVGTFILGRNGRSTGIPDRQKRFIELYTGECNYNGKLAAEKAGYKNGTVSARQLLDGKTYPLVTKAIERIQKENLKNAILTREQILEELSNYTMLDPMDLSSSGKTFVVSNLADVPPHVRRCIYRWKVNKWYDEDGNEQSETEVWVNPKIDSIRLLMQHFGMLTEKKEIRGNLGLSWDQLLLAEDNKPDGLDVIEGKIAEVEDG